MLINSLVVLDFDPYFIFYFTFYHGNVHRNSDVLRYLHFSLGIFLIYKKFNRRFYRGHHGDVSGTNSHVVNFAFVIVYVEIS